MANWYGTATLTAGPLTDAELERATLRLPGYATVTQDSEHGLIEASFTVVAGSESDAEATARRTAQFAFGTAPSSITMTAA
jgi:hypothetical protein